MNTISKREIHAGSPKRSVTRQQVSVAADLADAIIQLLEEQKRLLRKLRAPQHRRLA